MFGRIRASPVSSLESFEGSPPSKILKEDSFSIYEATLMKLKLGAKRDNFCMQMEGEEFRNDCSVTEEANMDVDSTPATASGDGKMTLMNTDSSSTITTFSDDVISTENDSEQPRQNNASILRFFKMKDPGPDTSLSAKKGSYGSVSSSGSVESNCTTSELIE